MVRFYIGEVQVFFPYDYVYPEQYEYMRYLKTALDAKGHCVLEMPTGTGKTVALLSLITSYQFAHPEVGKLIYCTRTVPEMEKALFELKTVFNYRSSQLESDAKVVCSKKSVRCNGATPSLSTTVDVNASRQERAQKFLGIGMASRRNLCIHPAVMEEASRDKVDEKCQELTAPWIRRNRLMTSLASSQQRRAPARDSETQQPHMANTANASVVAKTPNVSSVRPPSSNDIEDGAFAHSCCNYSAGDCHIPNANVSESGSRLSFCRFYENYETVWSPNLLPSGIYTLNDMKRFGETWHHPNKAEPTPAPFCPYFASRRALQIANVVVLNYQYILDPRVSQVAFMGRSGALDGGSVSNGKDPSIVVFDEAHNIDNVCIEAFSVNLNMMTLERARQNIEKLKKEVARAKSMNATQLLQEYEQLVHNLRSEGHLDDLALEMLAAPVLPQDVIKEAVPGTIRRAEFFLMTLEKLLLFLNSYIRVFSVKTEGPLAFLKRIKDETSVDPKTLRFCSERLKSLLNTLEVINFEEFSPLSLVADFFTLLAEGIYDPLIQLSCLDSSLAMKPVLEKFQSVILTSGTISPLFLYPKLLGFEPVITQSLPMSLDRNCICPLIVVKGADQVPLSSKFDLRSDNAVLRNFGTLLTELSKAVPDGIVCFFTSYAFMELTIAEWYRMGVLAEVMQYKLILMETKDVVATTLALHSYRQACDSGRGAVFFSVARGKVAEGIDFDRHYGRAVVLFGVPYQYTLSRILKARLDFMREHYQIPENEFLTFDAMRQAAQCVGRVIRSKSDYGLMIFADSRYSRLDKRQKLPDWILRHLDPTHMALSTDAALSIARRFLLDMSQPLRMTTKSRLDLHALEALQRHKAPDPIDHALQSATTEPSRSSSLPHSTDDAHPPSEYEPATSSSIQDAVSETETQPNIFSQHHIATEGLRQQ